MEIGLLLNFGAKSLQYKRLINKKYDSDQVSEPGFNGLMDCQDND